MAEYFDIYDEAGNRIGRALRSECHGNPALLHHTSHVVIFHPDGERLLLQKRSRNKDIQPGKWDTSVGGHVDYGESIEEALLREAREELGLHDIKPRPLFRYVFQSKVERELINAYATVVADETEIKFDPEEIIEGRFWSLADIEASIGKGVFTPNFEQEFVRLKEAISS